jgi:putative flippase GtrA
MPASSSPSRLSPFFSSKFLKFCAVGASGVIVNLGVMTALLSIDMRSSYASAWAIELSILSNFAVNELWTFRDQREEGTAWSRAGRFQLVSFVGALIQWSVFLAANIGFLWWVSGGDGVSQYFAGAEHSAAVYIMRPIESPPDVGAAIYASQLFGIGVATVWNYLANFYWTWRAKSVESSEEPQA